MSLNVIESIAADAALIARLRHDIHAHPELCFQERRTSALIGRTLSEWGIPVHGGLATTGIIGVLKNGDSNRSIGLRADMDALPLVEQNTFAHASVYSGKMHACGHDGHIAMLLAAAKHLAKHRNFNGTVYLIFQPAEEGGGGARVMIQDGLLQRFPMDAIFGMHNWPGLQAGRFALKAGPVFASNNEFSVTIRGKGTHAAMPYGGVDPLPIACQIVQAFQTIITRNIPATEAAVISVTAVQAGSAINVIPDACELRGTIRTFTLDVLDTVERRMRELAEGVCKAFGAVCELEFRRIYPPTINHQHETLFARRVLEDLVGPRNVQEFVPTMGAEDFSFFLNERPGCYFAIGNDPIENGTDDRRADGHGAGGCTLHSPSYDFNDALIPLGGSMWVRLVEAWLG